MTEPLCWPTVQGKKPEDEDTLLAIVPTSVLPCHRVIFTLPMQEDVQVIFRVVFLAQLSPPLGEVTVMQLTLNVASLVSVTAVPLSFIFMV